MTEKFMKETEENLDYVEQDKMENVLHQNFRYKIKGAVFL